jgi:hypothetical protein
VKGSVLRPVRFSVNSLACLPLLGSNLSTNYSITGVRGMEFLTLLPLELDVAYVDPPLSMPELRASLPYPPDTLPSSPRRENIMCSAVGLPWFTVARPLRVLYGTFGGYGVPNRGCVIGAFCLPFAE